jgi:hypothetical protein
MELYWGNRGSFTVTRYNQTVSNLILQAPKVDSVDANAATKLVFGLGDWQYVQYQRQNLNIGSIRNQGWEMQGTLTIGPIVTRGTYSWTKSRVIGLAPSYRSRFPSSQFQPGSTFSAVPEHTWAMGVQYANAVTSVSYNVHGQGELYNLSYEIALQDALANQTAYTRLSVRSPRISLPENYRAQTVGYALMDLNLLHHLTDHVDGVLQVQNIADAYQRDVGIGNATMGRQTKVGVRVTY